MWLSGYMCCTFIYLYYLNAYVFTRAACHSQDGKLVYCWVVSTPVVC